MLWSIKVIWLARFGLIAQFLAGLIIVLDIWKPADVRALGEHLNSVTESVWRRIESAKTALTSVLDRAGGARARILNLVACLLSLLFGVYTTWKFILPKLVHYTETFNMEGIPALLWTVVCLLLAFAVVVVVLFFPIIIMLIVFTYLIVLAVYIIATPILMISFLIFLVILVLSKVSLFATPLGHKRARLAGLVLFSSVHTLIFWDRKDARLWMWMFYQGALPKAAVAAPSPSFNYCV